MPKHVVSLAPS